MDVVILVLIAFCELLGLPQMGVIFLFLFELKKNSRVKPLFLKKIIKKFQIKNYSQ